MGEVDSHVGKRIRNRRVELGKTQQSLAEDVELTFQQIQKYEQGANRVAAPYLWAISNALGVRVDYFFKGLDDDCESQSDTDIERNMTDDNPAIGGQCLRLLRFFRGLDASQRSAVLGLVTSMSAVELSSTSESEVD